MKLAVFTNQFPGPVCTFFARDMRGLLDAGIEIDVFPVHPLNEALWKYVPAILNERILPRKKVYHLALDECLRHVTFWPSKELVRFLTDSLAAARSSTRFGIEAVAKTTYAVLKGWVWAQRYPTGYDHILAYWGNYAGTCAYIYHRLCGKNVPFSIFLHANADLYRNAIFMKTKLLYADNILTCSDFNRQFILDRFCSIGDHLDRKIRVHQHGLNLADVTLQVNHRDPETIIAVGRFVKQKGFDHLLYAMKILKDRGVKVKLDLVGDGGDAGFLRSLVSNLNIGDMVEFSGWLPADEVPRVIGKAALLVHPSPDIGDGVPNVIKEAMAVGTPVIGSKVAGIPELLGDGRGILVPAKDINALANAIEALLADGELRQRYAQRAREHAEKTFDLWGNGQQLARFLASTQRCQREQLV